MKTKKTFTVSFMFHIKNIFLKRPTKYIYKIKDNYLNVYVIIDNELTYIEELYLFDDEIEFIINILREYNAT